MALALFIQVFKDEKCEFLRFLDGIKSGFRSDDFGVPFIRLCRTRPALFMKNYPEINALCGIQLA